MVQSSNVCLGWYLFGIISEHLIVSKPLGVWLFSVVSVLGRVSTGFGVISTGPRSAAKPFPSLRLLASLVVLLGVPCGTVAWAFRVRGAGRVMRASCAQSTLAREAVRCGSLFLRIGAWTRKWKHPAARSGWLFHVEPLVARWLAGNPNSAPEHVDVARSDGECGIRTGRENLIARVEHGDAESCVRGQFNRVLRELAQVGR